MFSLKNFFDQKLRRGGPSKVPIKTITATPPGLPKKWRLRFCNTAKRRRYKYTIRRKTNLWDHSWSSPNPWWPASDIPRHCTLPPGTCKYIICLNTTDRIMINQHSSAYSNNIYFKKHTVVFIDKVQSTFFFHWKLALFCGIFFVKLVNLIRL